MKKETRTGDSRLLSGDAFLIDQQQGYIKVISVRVSDQAVFPNANGATTTVIVALRSHCHLFKYTTNVVLLTLGADTDTTGGGRWKES